MSDEGALLALEARMLAHLDDLFARWRDEPIPFTEAELRAAFRAGLAAAGEVRTEYGVQFTADGVTSVLERRGRFEAERESHGILPELAPTVVERVRLRTNWRPVS